MDLTDLHHVIPDDPEPKSLTPQDKMPQWHYCLGHTSFEQLKIMAKQGLLPKKIENCQVPVCAACKYGKLT